MMKDVSNVVEVATLPENALMGEVAPEDRPEVTTSSIIIIGVSGKDKNFLFVELMN